VETDAARARAGGPDGNGPGGAAFLRGRRKRATETLWEGSTPLLPRPSSIPRGIRPCQKGFISIFTRGTIGVVMLLATPNSGRRGVSARRLVSPPQRAVRFWVTVAAGLASAFSASAQSRLPVAEPAAVRVERAYVQCRTRMRTNPTNTEAAWQFARACFDWADFATNNAQRAELAGQGIAACRAAIERDPKLAAAHYYLGLNLGQLARTRRLSALHLLDEMEAAWLRAIELDATFDFAGPHRSLGLLYKDAPGWPTSLGSRKKARRHLQKAVELSPAYPDNQLAWLEALLDWGDKDAALAHLPTVATVLADARAKLTGDDWALSWQDWEARWKRINARATVQRLESPLYRK
jgi:tetratricopeptide (TPR) repeat protein